MAAKISAPFGPRNRVLAAKLSPVQKWLIQLEDRQSRVEAAVVLTYTYPQVLVNLESNGSSLASFLGSSLVTYFSAMWPGSGVLIKTEDGWVSLADGVPAYCLPSPNTDIPDIWGTARPVAGGYEYKERTYADGILLVNGATYSVAQAQQYLLSHPSVSTITNVILWENLSSGDAEWTLSGTVSKVTTELGLALVVSNLPHKGLVYSSVDLPNSLESGTSIVVDKLAISPITSGPFSGSGADTAFSLWVEGRRAFYAKEAQYYADRLSEFVGRAKVGMPIEVELLLCKGYFKKGVRPSAKYPMQRVSYNAEWVDTGGAGHSKYVVSGTLRYQKPKDSGLETVEQAIGGERTYDVVEHVPVGVDVPFSRWARSVTMVFTNTLVVDENGAPVTTALTLGASGILEDKVGKGLRYGAMAQPLPVVLNGVDVEVSAPLGRGLLYDPPLPEELHSVAVSQPSIVGQYVADVILESVVPAVSDNWTPLSPDDGSLFTFVFLGLVGFSIGVVSDDPSSVEGVTLTSSVAVWSPLSATSPYAEINGSATYDSAHNMTTYVKYVPFGGGGVLWDGVSAGRMLRPDSVTPIGDLPEIAELYGRLKGKTYDGRGYSWPWDIGPYGWGDCARVVGMATARYDKVSASFVDYVFTDLPNRMVVSGSTLRGVLAFKANLTKEAILAMLDAGTLFQNAQFW